MTDSTVSTNNGSASTQWQGRMYPEAYVREICLMVQFYRKLNDLLRLFVAANLLPLGSLLTAVGQGIFDVTAGIDQPDFVAVRVIQRQLASTQVNLAFGASGNLATQLDFIPLRI